MPNREELLQRLEKIATDVGVEIDSLVDSFEAFVKKELSAADDSVGKDDTASVTGSGSQSETDLNSSNTAEAQTDNSSDSSSSTGEVSSNAPDAKSAVDGEGSSTDADDKGDQAVS